MKFPDRIHKFLLYDIIRTGVLDFIYNDEDGQQQEEEESNNYVSLISSYEEEEELRKSEDEYD